MFKGWLNHFFASIGDGVRFPIINQPEEDSLLNAQHRWLEEGELDGQEDQQYENKEDSSANSLDVSTAELVNENEVETQMPNRARPDVVAVQEYEEVKDGTSTL